jgi:hypothetical protein
LPALYLIAVLGLLAYRGYIQRQNVKPFAELAGDELLVGNRMVAPTAVDRVPVKSLASLRIVGPSTGRYIRCCFADGAARDIGPYLMQSALEARLVDWLGRELPRTISVVAQEPAGFFEKTRASY